MLRDARLSPKEYAVWRLVAEGLPSKDISATLGIGEDTVRAHISNVYTRMGMNGCTRIEACRKLGLLTLVAPAPQRRRRAPVADGQLELA